VICFSTAAIDEATTRAASVADSVWSGTAYDPVTHDSLPIFGQVLPWDDPESGVSTRGKLITSSTLESFSVSAFQTRTATSETTSETTTLFTDEENTTSDNSTWVYDSGKIYYWPGDAFTLDFYAVAPADVVTSNGFSYANDDTRNEFTYIVPSSPDKQQDLMVASETKVKGNNNAPVGLAFEHICAAVEFNVGNADDFSGTITEIRVSGIANTATYTFGSGWSTPSGSATYTITPEDGNTFGDNQRLILLPQTLGSDAKIEVVYTLNGATTSSTYTYSLSGQTWAANNCYRYSMNISPEITITFDNSQLDAHYTTTTATISVLGLKDTESWILTAAGSTTDDAGNDVSIQLEDSVDSYVKVEGYWLQNLRGTNQFSRKGSGTYSVRIFAPENTGEEDRTFTFTLTSGTKTFAVNTKTELKQYCPVWTGDGYGWERTYSEAGPYGNERTRFSVRVIPYQITILNTYADDAITLLKELMREYGISYKDNSDNTSDDNSNYVVTVDKYYCYNERLQKYLGWTAQRYYFTIDYSKMNDGKTNDDTNGLLNTKGMNELNLSDEMCPFEIAVDQTEKVEVGEDTEEDDIKSNQLFRPASDSNQKEKYYGERQLAQQYKADEVSESAILNYILKKNAYTKTTTTDATTGTSTTKLKLVELKWYLPAKGQNANPDGKDLSKYWSSTSIVDDGTHTNEAYLLDGTTAERNTEHSVCAVRNKE
jgi:hypothetical protein